MAAMKLQPVVQVRVRWKTAAEGGRPDPPPGPTYASIARLANNGENFSVFLRFPEVSRADQRWEHAAELTMLAADLLPDIAAEITPGTRLILQEGHRSVGECEVLSVDTALVVKRGLTGRGAG